jgi:ribosomal-protein-alanine N-acetyltransferase
MLRGERVNVRLAKEADLETLMALWSDVRARGVYFPLGLTSEVVFLKDFQETGFWKDNVGRMLIEDKDGRLQGQIGCFKPAPYMDALEIFYIILNPESRGKGYMTEALRLFSDYLFDVHKVNRLQLTVAVGNESSRRVAEKGGFKSEGILRGAAFLAGEPRDMEMFSLLRSERSS